MKMNMAVWSVHLLSALRVRWCTFNHSIRDGLEACNWLRAQIHSFETDVDVVVLLVRRFVGSLCTRQNASTQNIVLYYFISVFSTA